ncbi:hypothetical protein [Candidatus Regiella insecticola]|uniref:hypothetical protein n=1 Tax=Candidatus Regiella insecticola TaxID=138073 RepID=UPI0015963EFE|nr:hypothetical protein [Candidatus Regiella insecticola]
MAKFRFPILYQWKNSGSINFKLSWQEGTLSAYTIASQATNLLIGVVPLITILDGLTDFGYWIGEDY